MAHEILHALGWTHEQNRADRDKYIKIIWKNIKSGYENNFEKQEGDTSGTDYDFKRIMHYNEDAFSKNDLPTMEVQEPKHEGALLSFADYFSKENTDRGMSVLDRVEVNSVYSLHEYCNGNWAFSD